MDFITLDALGGCALTGSVGNADDGKRLTLTLPNLRALDLHEDERLEVIDLRQCGEQAYLHLQLDRLTRLHTLYLPPLTGGAVVHLFSLMMPPTLRIYGAVCEVDADWQVGTFRHTAVKAPWKGVCLLGRDASDEVFAPIHQTHDVAPTYSTTLTVVLNPAVLSAQMTLCGAGEWLLTDASPIACLTVNGPPRVWLHNAKALQRLAIQSVSVVEASGLDTLANVTGLTETNKTALTLRGNMHRLALNDSWGHVQLHTPRLTLLELGQAAHLTLYHCRTLHAVSLPTGVSVDCYGSVPTPLLDQARFFMDEATLQQSLARLDAGEADLLDSVLRALSQRISPQAAFHSLNVLLALAKQGVDPAALWTCRRTLNARQRSHKRQRPMLSEADYQRADLHWVWDLPADRLTEGLTADLTLWAHCYQSACIEEGVIDGVMGDSKSKDSRASAAGFRTTLLKETQAPDKLGDLLRAVAMDQASAVLTTLATEVLVTLYGHGEWPRWQLPAPQEGVTRYLPRLLNQEGITPQQHQAVLVAIANLTPWARLPQQLARQLAMSPGPVRALIITLARQPDRWFQRRLPRYSSERQMSEVKQQLMQLALLPSKGAVAFAARMQSGNAASPATT